MTAQTAGMPVLLDGPLPVAPAFNLFTVAQEVPPAVDAEGGNSDRWLGGANVYTYPDTVGNGIDPCNRGTNRFKDDGDSIANPVFGAFTGYVPITCSSFGLQWDRLQTRANAVLSATDPYRAERQLASAAYKLDNPAFADTDVDILAAGVAQKIVESLSLLENAVGATGRAGVIHGDPATIAAWTSWNLLDIIQGQLRTRGGTPVVRGTGYIGAHPSSKAAPSTHQSWAWASGPVLFQRSAVITLPGTLKEALDRSENTVTYRAERDLLVVWDKALQAAVLVDRSL